jgi:hypothetical protein
LTPGGWRRFESGRAGPCAAVGARRLLAGEADHHEAADKHAKAELASALRDAARAAQAEDPAGLAGALRAVAAAAERLALALEGDRQHLPLSIVPAL